MLPERVRAIAQIGDVVTRISARTHETPTPRYFALIRVAAAEIAALCAYRATSAIAASRAMSVASSIARLGRAWP